jgi:hypothetical protein
MRVKINMQLLVAIAEQRKREAELVEGPRLALYAPGPEIVRAPAAPEQSRGVWQCYGPEEE